MNAWAFLILGILFLAFNLFGVGGPILATKLRGKYSSPACIPPMPGQRGFTQAGQLGNVSESNGSYLLKADYGGSRKLQPMPDGSFHVVEEEMPDHSRSFVIANWTFRRSS